MSNTVLNLKVSYTDATLTRPTTLAVVATR